MPFFGYQNYIVETPSMHPTIPKYSIVYVKELNEEEKRELKVDDIVAISTSGKPLLHRIIEVNQEEGFIITQGDRNQTPDQPVAYEKVIGLNVLVIPYIGILFSSIYPGLIILMGILIYIISKEIFKEIKKK